VQLLIRRAYLPVCLLASISAQTIKAVPFLAASVSPAVAQVIIDGGATVIVPDTQASPFNTGGSLIVGSTGQGTLIVQDGGRVNSSSISRVGRFAGSTGSVTVTGAGSAWVNNGELHFGPSGGDATVLISDGGLIQTLGFQGIRANLGTGTVTITVTGAGSRLISAGSTDIGTGASLTLSDGGTARTSGNYRMPGNGVINIGAAAGEAPAAPGSILTGNVIFTGTDTRLVFNHTDADYTFARLVTGIGQVAIHGGTTSLTNNNTYTGGTQLNGGVAQISANAQLGDAAAPLFFNGGTLRTTTSFSMARGTTLNAGGATFEALAGTTLTQSGVVSGSGPFTKTADGIVVLSGANTYTGGTAINQGTLRAGSTSAFGSNSAVRLANAAGATLDLAGFDNVIGSLAGGGTTGGNVTLGSGRLTAGGNNASTTYGGVISGTGGLTKTGTGTMVLTGINSYTGGTMLENGTLQVAADANLGGANGMLTFDGGTLRTTASFDSGRPLSLVGSGTLLTDAGTTLALTGAVSGSGDLTKSGPGTLQIESDSSGFVGTTSINAGTLAVHGSLCGDVNVFAGGTLQGTGTVCDTSNFDGGLVAPGNSIGTLTVAGNYTGTGGTLEIETVLGDDASPTDLLVITGDTAGTTNVQVINLGGAGAQTADGIKIIDVGGASNGSFTLLGDFEFQGQPAVAAGAYAYVLEQNGLSTPTDGDWYLRSSLANPANPAAPTPIFQPGVPLFESYASVLQKLNELDTLKQRVGNRRWHGGPQTASEGSGVWGRIKATRAELQPARSTSGTDIDVTTWKLQVGLDVALHEDRAGRLVGGIAAHYGSAPADVASLYGVGKIDGVGYGVSGTLTWYGSRGLYIDTQVQATRYDSDLKSATLGTTLVEGNDGYGYALSVEPGYRLALSQNWSVTPQAQLVYARVGFDDFADPFGARVSLKDGDSLTGRVGLSGDYETTWEDAAGQTSRLHAYAIASLYHDQLDGATVDVAGTQFESEPPSRWGSIGIGGTLDWADGRYSLYGEALATRDLGDKGDSRALSGTVGLRVHW
jgi:fibronectin-binding autotransporter adhesin